MSSSIRWRLPRRRGAENEGHVAARLCRLRLSSDVVFALEIVLAALDSAFDACEAGPRGKEKSCAFCGDGDADAQRKISEVNAPILLNERCRCGQEQRRVHRQRLR